MPLVRDTPQETGRPIVVDQIVGYAADLVHGILTIFIDRIDDSGKVVKNDTCKSSLRLPDGTQRFTQAESDVNKSAIYRIGIEDGHLPAGTIA